MSREALGFFWAVAVHAGRAMTFRADGAGLPKKPGGAFAAIFMIAMLMAILRHAVATGSMHPVGAGMGFMITIMLLAMMLGEKRFQCLGMYLCLSAGIDLVAIVTSGLGSLDSTVKALLATAAHNGCGEVEVRLNEIKAALRSNTFIGGVH